MIRVFTDSSGLLLDQAGVVRRPAAPLNLDILFTATDPAALVRNAWMSGSAATLPASPGAPIGTQEVWAAGVTYLRSRTARME